MKDSKASLDNQTSIAVLTERVRNMEGGINDTNKKIDGVITKIDSLIEKVDNKYVTKESFEPVKKIVYGIVALVLTAIIGALISLVLR